MDNLDWCKNQSKGIKKTEPNLTIASDYLRKADESLLVMDVSPSIEWKVVAGYYACYDSIYALLSKVGIKSEIHECTLSLLKPLGFSNEQIKFMTDLKTARHDAQYYTDRIYSMPEIKKIKEFVLDCKSRFNKLDNEKIIKEIFGNAP